VLLLLSSCSSGQFRSWKLYVLLKYSKTSNFKGNINRTMHSLTFERKILECYWFFFCTFQSGCLLRNHNVHPVHARNARSTRARTSTGGRISRDCEFNTSNHFFFFEPRLATYLIYKKLLFAWVGAWSLTNNLFSSLTVNNLMILGDSYQHCCSFHNHTYIHIYIYIERKKSGDTIAYYKWE